MTTLGDHEYTLKKDRMKRRRVAAQWVALALMLGAMAYALFFLQKYQPYEPETVSSTTNTGFIALSYTGVDRLGRTNELIGEKRLDDHLSALRKQGYVTITNQDVRDYYEEGKPLPKKALYLMFEDGRRDTAIFAERLMEKYNYHATMYSYAQKLDDKDPKFLSRNDLKAMLESSFWDMGSNGYRLHFINVYDRYNNYIGELNPLEFSMIRSSLGRNYNHYLMDYLRDARGLPRESYNHMVSRLSFDYETLRDIYTRELGFVPDAYAIMHANTTEFGNNHDSSAVNEKWIRQLFLMNFNREGSSFNQRNSSVYDLTRMQPGSSWPANHLLMRIQSDINTPGDIHFIEGDTARQKEWDHLAGASEIDGDTIYLTTTPYKNALVRSRLSGKWQNLNLSVRLKGNTFGRQQVFLRADKSLQNYILIELGGNELWVVERRNGRDTELFRKSVDAILGNPILSTEEARRDAEVRDYQTLARYARTTQQAEFYEAKAVARANEPARSVADGGTPYNRAIDRNERSNHLLTLALVDENLNISLDGHSIGESLLLDVTTSGKLLLGADWRGVKGWSQRNLADSVYDAVFQGLTIRTATGRKVEDETVLYTMELKGYHKYLYQLESYWEDILNWFLRYV
jgi:hypothetical protein